MFHIQSLKQCGFVFIIFLSQKNPIHVSVLSKQHVLIMSTVPNCQSTRDSVLFQGAEFDVYEKFADDMLKPNGRERLNTLLQRSDCSLTCQVGCLI